VKDLRSWCQRRCAVRHPHESPRVHQAKDKEHRTRALLGGHSFVDRLQAVVRADRQPDRFDWCAASHPDRKRIAMSANNPDALEGGVASIIKTEVVGAGVGHAVRRHEIARPVLADHEGGQPVFCLSPPRSRERVLGLPAAGEQQDGGEDGEDELHPFMPDDASKLTRLDCRRV
jgi:hypothetical protein